ncbi:transposon Ty3-I Gag-Pol polyprotein [Trichonephila clavipes]|nr:transposon Ty3-I Gag-Pol polyprotein [Trichonephila clavipes]
MTPKNISGKVRYRFITTLEAETASHIKILQADQWMTPDELGKACDIFFISKNRSQHDSRNPNAFKDKNEAVYSKNRANMANANQFQRQFPKQNRSVRIDTAVSCYVFGGPHFARNCTKETMKLENKDTCYTVNQIATSIPNQNNFSFNELQYADVIVDKTSLSATLDSGANSVIINAKYVSEEKRIHSQIVLTSCFGENRKANVSEFTISLKGGEKKKILAAVCKIEAAILLPSKVFEFLKSESDESRSTDASCNPVCLQNETEGGNHVEVSGGVANSEKLTDGSNLFLLKVSETFDECLYDVSHISNSGIRDKVQTLIQNYIPNKTESTALKMKIILSDEKPIAQR